MAKKDYIIRESLDVIDHALQLITHRFRSIDSPDAFLDDENAQMALDAIYMRLQMIAQKIDRIEQTDPGFFKKYQIDISNIQSMDRHIELNYDELDHELIYDICKNILPEFNESLNTIQF